MRRYWSFTGWPSQKKWDNKLTDEALSMAIEGMEHIWELKQEDMIKNAMINASKKQPRVWS
jgi:hypothetical protein